MPASQDIERIARALVLTGQDEDGFLSDERVLETIKAVGKIEMAHKAEILKAYWQLAQRLMSEQRAVVTSATTLTSVEHDEIEQSIRRSHPEVKKIIWQSDSMLVGGITVLIADTWYDFSIRQHLATIKERLSV